MTDLVEMIAKALVEQPDRVKVSEVQEGPGTTVYLQVAADDMGKVIGKQGRIAKALRTVVKAASVKTNRKVNVEILSDEEAPGRGAAAAAESEQPAGQPEQPEQPAEVPAGQSEDLFLQEGHSRGQEE